jgi:chitin synthase
MTIDDTGIPAGVLRYSAIHTRDAREYGNGEFGPDPRFNAAQIFTVVTMYNEAPEELLMTLKGLAKNMQYMAMRTDESVTNRCAVCIVSDGRTKLNPATARLLTALNLYDEKQVELALEESDEVGMHLFENTLDNFQLFSTHVNRTDGTVARTKHTSNAADLEAGGNSDNDAGLELDVGENVGLRVMFALKEHNAGKIDSHHWFFQAFGQRLQPKYTFLVDVGTVPQFDAFYHIYRAFERNRQIAGACGQILARNRNSFSPIIAGQYFEYKIAGIIDKAMESVLGYVSVLPGAFSAYRYRAIQGPPLDAYFRHITHSGELDPISANMYLAEDRILCFEIFSKENQAYTLHFVKEAVAECDVPLDIVSLMKQRRRWLNGSFFAQLYAILHFGWILTRTNHSLARKLLAIFQFLFYVLSLAFAWLGPAIFYCFMIHTGNDYAAAYLPPSIGSVVVPTLNVMFWLLIVLQLAYGLGQKPHKAKLFYSVVYTFFGVVFSTLIVLAVLNIVRSNIEYGLVNPVLLLVSMIIFTYLFASLINGDLLDVLTSMAQYIFMLPTFSIAFPIYSLCNLNDVSWGTKNLETTDAQSQAMEERYTTFRMQFLLFYMVSNFIVIFTMTQFSWSSVVFFSMLAYSTLYFNVIRLALCMVYVVIRVFTRSVEDFNNAEERVAMKDGFRSPHRYQAATQMATTSSRFLNFLVRPFLPRVWLDFLTVSILSPVYAVLSGGWIVVTLLLSMALMILYPIGPYVLMISAITWRYLAIVDYKWNSVFGRLSRLVRADARGVIDNPPHLTVLPEDFDFSEDSMMTSVKKIVTHAFTKASFSYLLFVKPIVTIVSAATVFFMIGVILYPTGLQCIYVDPLFTESFLCIYLDPTSSALVFTVSLIVSILFVFLLALTVDYLGLLQKRICSDNLGSDIFNKEDVANGEVEIITADEEDMGELKEVGNIYKGQSTDFTY